jgi:hypothetical protein
MIFEYDLFSAHTCEISITRCCSVTPMFEADCYLLQVVLAVGRVCIDFVSTKHGKRASDLHFVIDCFAQIA